MNQKALQLAQLPADFSSIQVEEVPDTRTPDEIAEDEAIQTQAMSEDVKLGKVKGKLDRTVEFGGKKWPIANKVGLMPLMEFAYYANSGADTGDMGALVAIYEMLKDCFKDDETFAEFRKHAKRIKADAEELMPVVQQTIELLTARPTRQDSDSFTASQETPESLTDNSSGQVAGLVPVAKLGHAGFMG